MDCQRMHAAGKLAGKSCIDHAVALNPALPLERVRHDIDPEVGFPARPVTGVPLMLVRLVDDAHALWTEGCR